MNSWSRNFQVALTRGGTKCPRQCLEMGGGGLAVAMRRVLLPAREGEAGMLGLLHGTNCPSKVPAGALGTNVSQAPVADEGK